MIPKVSCTAQEQCVANPYLERHLIPLGQGIGSNEWLLLQHILAKWV